MNCVPERFPVEPDASRIYEVTNFDAKTVRLVTGQSLSQSLAVTAAPSHPLRWIVHPADRR